MNVADIGGNAKDNILTMIILIAFFLYIYSSLNNEKISEIFKKINNFFGDGNE